jgi:hypothetical protein
MGPLLNWKSDLSFRNGVLLHNQHILPTNEYACPALRPADSCLVRKIQVLPSKFLRLSNGELWYFSNWQILGYFVVPLFADHIRAFTATIRNEICNKKVLVYVTQQKLNLCHTLTQMSHDN